MSFESFFDAYIECALWSSTDNLDDSGGDPLDSGEYTLTKAAIATLRREAKDFYRSNEPVWRDVWDDAQAGHDFWLTRNGHGAGFWDRGHGELGKRLSEACKPYGSCDLYVSRRRIHVA
jgi:hypothetical protein